MTSFNSTFRLSMNTIKHILLLFILSILCGADLVRANEKQEPTVVHPSDSPVLFGVISRTCRLI